MAQSRQMQLRDVKEWLNNETAPALKPLKDKVGDLLREVKFRIDDTTQSGKKILENSEAEMEKSNPKTHRFARNANKFAENLLGATQALMVPEEHNYDKVQAFCGELEKACANMDLLRRGGYPYISPYFIFDRRRLDVSLKRLFDITKELRAFLTTKYAKAKTIEDTRSIIDKLQQTVGEAELNQKETMATEEKRKEIEQKIAETRQKIEQIQARAELNELLGLNSRIEELRQNVKHNLRYLQKPFFKLQSQARAGKVTIPLDEMNKLNDYLSDPFLALATDENDYLSLKSILRKLDSTILQGKLKLKSTRLRKAQEQIGTVLNNDSLFQLQTDCKDTLSRQKHLLATETIFRLQNQLREMHTRLKELQKENELALSKSRSLENEHAKLQEKITHMKNDIEKGILQITERNVQIALST